MSKPILLVTLDYSPNLGGVARYLSSIARVFSDEMIVIAPWVEGEKETATLWRKKLLYKHFRPAWLATVFLLIKHKNDYRSVLVSHVLPIGFAAYLARFITRKPYSVIVHGLDVALARKSWRKRMLMQLVLRNAKVVIANSEVLANEVVELDGAKKVIPLLPPLNLPSTPPIIKNESPWKVLLSVSRLVSRKGHSRVFEALSHLRANNLLPNVSYIIVGEGTERNVLEYQVKELGLEDVVVFYGAVADEDLPRVYGIADVFVLPTVVDSVDREGFGYVYVEAAMYGVPSIATDSSGVNEAVLHNQTGLLVPDDNIDELAKAIYKLLTQNETRTRLGETAQKRVFSDFDENETFAILKELL